MLAMDVNENAGCLTPRGAYASIASMLAPTGGRCSLVQAVLQMPTQFLQLRL